MKVISLKNIENVYTEGQKTLELSPKQIITPSAKDFLKNKGVAIVYAGEGTQQQGTSRSSASSNNTNNNNLSEKEIVSRISSLLVNKHGITNSEKVSQIAPKVIKQITN